MNASKTKPLIILYTWCVLAGSHLVPCSPMEAGSRFSRTLPWGQPGLPTAFPAGAPADGERSRLRAGRGSPAEGRPAGSALHSGFFSPSQLASGMNSLLKYLPVPGVTKVQKYGSIFIPKEGEVTHFIEAHLAASPKDKGTGQNTSGVHPGTRLKDMRIKGERRGSITRISRGSWSYCRMKQNFQQWRGGNMFSESFSSLAASSGTMILFLGCWINSAVCAKCNWGF